MRGISLVLLLLACSALGKTVPPDNGVYDYHLKVGMHEADRIRKAENEQRVAGGSTTTVAAVPYQAGLIITFRLIQTSVCGGTIISDTRILTGAHCNNDGNNIANSITVVVGSNFLFAGGTRVVYTGVTMHPGYNPWILANDVAVVFIPRISFSLFIQPINLPTGSELYSNYVGTTGLASGFGITRDGDAVGLTQMISSVNLRVIPNDECASTYGGVIQPSHMCTSGAGGVGTCLGDTGGPLVATVNNRRVLIGISSFTPRDGCQRNLPSGFSRVTTFASWIREQ
ncbi:collagenase-like [Ostrinia nubilalis]|uniref:collagenase-like n=1 Tax=Ostrinia nubilalis TaxID=29057 RepID=UPI0030825527